MTHLLAIKAHPLTAAESTSVNVFDEFLVQYQQANPEDTVQVLDLFKEAIPEVDATLLTAWSALKSGTPFSDLSAETQELLTRFEQATEQFLAADKIVIANALWNLNIPTRLKSWFDTVNVAGKTFRYSETGPVPLTSGKKVLHIQSNGGSYAGSDFSSQYVKSMMAFVGVTDHQQLLIEGIDHHPEQRETILQDVFSQVSHLVRTF